MKEEVLGGHVARGPRLLDLVREAIRRRNYSYRTEETYVHWIRRFIYFSGKRHPVGLGATTMIYQHVLNKGGRGVPLDAVGG